MLKAEKKCFCLKIKFLESFKHSFLNMKKIIPLIIFLSISFCQEFQVGDSINDLKGILCGNGNEEWHYSIHTGKVLFISSFATW